MVSARRFPDNAKSARASKQSQGTPRRSQTTTRPDCIVIARHSPRPPIPLIVVLLWALACAALAGQALALVDEPETDFSPRLEAGSAEPEDAVIVALLEQAEAARSRGWLLSPPGRSAADRYREVLEIEPDHIAALGGLRQLQRELVDEAAVLARESDHEAAKRLVQRAGGLAADPLLMAWAEARIVRIRDEKLAAAEQAVQDLIAEGRFDEADERLTELVAMGMERGRLEAVRGRLIAARLYGALSPGQIFSDPMRDLDDYGPTMVVIPVGSFMKGSPDNEPGRQSHEGPRYRVTFERGFALARTETTVAEFARFIEHTGYQTDAERRGWTRVYEPRPGRMTRRNRINWRHDYLGREAEPDLPVIHVSWRDAAAYADWLAERTGRPYRLPSEAEFEYALRAGTQTRFWWGDDSPTEPLENLTGDGDISPTNSRWSVAFPRYSDGFWGPAPVASLQANPFGLYDMGGNVMEWTEDCWHDSFVRAPVDGSAWINPGCTQRVIRGGSWSSTPDMSRSAFRVSGAEDSTDMRVGFRVARDL